MTLDTDNGPGLRISQWLNEGEIFLSALSSIAEVHARIYPTGVGNRWHLQLERPGPVNETNIRASGCATWFNVDQWRYARLPVDEFEFLGNGTPFSSVQVPSLRLELTKLTT